MINYDEIKILNEDESFSSHEEYMECENFLHDLFKIHIKNPDGSYKTYREIFNEYNEKILNKKEKK